MANSIFPPSGGGGGTPGGDPTDVQFNDSGSFGGNAVLTFDDSGDGVFSALSDAVHLGDYDYNVNGTNIDLSDSLKTIYIVANDNNTDHAFVLLNDTVAVIAANGSGVDSRLTIANASGDALLGSSNGTSPKIEVLQSSNSIQLSASTGVINLNTDTVIGNGVALRTDTTTAHTALIQAYDVNGTTYRTFLTLTNGDVPDCTVSAPSGGTMTVQPTTYKSSDGSSGVTAGPFTVITAITVKNGLVVALTGS